MFKRMTLLRRRTGDTAAAFQAHWSSVHSTFVLELPGIRRYVQNDVIRRPSRVLCDGIVELWFDDAAALQAAFDSEAGRALPLDEANFLGGKIVSDVSEHVLVAGHPGGGAAKLISVVRSAAATRAPAWDRWHEHLRRAQSGIEGLVRMSHHRVASQRHVGSEANGPHDIAGFIVYHFRDAATRAAFVHGACDAVERIAADRGAAHARIPVIERIVKDGAIDPVSR